jgi:hypothetical protein
VAQTDFRHIVLLQQLEERLDDAAVPGAARPALDRARIEGAAMTPRQLEAHARDAVERWAAS